MGMEPTRFTDLAGVNRTKSLARELREALWAVPESTK